MAIRTTQNMTPAGTTHYLYDLSGRLIVEADASGNTLREYVWIDDTPLAVVADVDTLTPHLYYVHPDHLDRPSKMTDDTKAVVWDAAYRPFGEVVSITGSASNNLRFPGQYFLLESGLHYNWHRHYDPTIGRYIQPDPLGFVDGPSVYQYARQSPSMYTDNDGLFVAPLSPVLPLLRPLPPVPFMGPSDPSTPYLAPEDKDPCAGLRKVLAEHEQRLRDYMSDPYRHDNKGFLGKGRDEEVILGRIKSLQRQIEDFRKQLKECEEKHGRPLFTSCHPNSGVEGSFGRYTGRSY